MKYPSTLIGLFFSIVAVGQTFTDVATSAGLDHEFHVGDYHFGGGAAVIDFDNDGFEDIYLIGGSNDDKLYRNNGAGGFIDVSSTAGIATTFPLHTIGAIAGDIDNDGHKDLFIAARCHKDSLDTYGPNVLLRNLGNGTFTDITVAAGISNDRAFSTSAAFTDVNGNGLLDIYVVNYWHEPFYDIVNSVGSLANFGDWEFTGHSNYLYINNGDGTFTESGNSFGVDDPGVGWACTFSDFDSDLDPDLMVLNDFGHEIEPSVMLRNESSDSFTDISTPSGFNNLNGYDLTAMGVATGDYDEDGDLDYYVTNTGKNFLFGNNGNGTFTDETHFAGVENEAYDVSLDTIYPWATMPVCGCLLDSVVVSWGTNFIDADNDTDLDLFVSNGGMNPNVFFGTHMANAFYENNGDATFTDISNSSMTASNDISRGSVNFDYDNDGDQDLLVVVQENHPNFEFTESTNVHLYRNDNNNGNSWLKVKLNSEEGNKDGIGARVSVHVDNRTLIREVRAGGSVHSSNSTIAHFGLGSYSTLDTVRIVWRSGCITELTNVSANQLLEVNESCLITTVEDESLKDSKVLYGWNKDEFFLLSKQVVGIVYAVDGRQVTTVKGNRINLHNFDSGVYMLVTNHTTVRFSVIK